jgi:ribosome modulation factor
MSEREKIANATRQGKKAYWEGKPLSANPMRAATSRQAWEQAWLDEQKIDRIDAKYRDRRTP